jgi:hypothetical protein
MRRASNKLYERINFLPFADAMFSGVAIVIIILVSYSQKSSEAVSRPQADIILRCELGSTFNSYTVRFAEAEPGKENAAGPNVAGENVIPEIKRQLGLWPELTVRVLLLESQANWYCTDLLKKELERLRDSLVEDGRTGMAIPLIAVAYRDDMAPGGRGR